MAKILERRGVVICGASGDEFKHDGTASGRNVAAAKAAAHQRKYLAEQAAPVEHREDRDPVVLRRLRTQQQSPPQPSGRPSDNYDPGAIQWAAEVGRHDILWQDTPAGRRMKKHCKQLSEQHETKKQAAADRAAHEAATADLVAWGQRNREWVYGSESTVEDCENADLLLELCKQGRRDEAIEMDRAYREKVLERTADKMANIEKDRQAMASQIDAIRSEALNRPVEEAPKISTASAADIPIDRSKAVIVRKVNTPHGVREVSEIVDAE